MEKSSWLLGALLLLAGLGIGYAVGQAKTTEIVVDDIQGSSDMHVMPDGSLIVDEPMSMEDMMHSMNAELEGKTGDAFDRAFLSEMIIHHQGAVEMAGLALENAKHQEIKDLAEGIIKAQNKEIADMLSWQKDWYSMTE